MSEFIVTKVAKNFYTVRNTGEFVSIAQTILPVQRTITNNDIVSINLVLTSTSFSDNINFGSLA